MKKRLLSIIQLGFGIALVGLLINGINKSSFLVTFHTPSATVQEGDAYKDNASPPNRFIVLESVTAGSEIKCLKTGKLPEEIPPTGALTRLEGSGDASINWNRRQIENYGLTLLSSTFKTALDNWYLLLLGASMFGICLFFCILRWNLLLKAQELDLPFRRVFSLYFVGQFFNSFMPGAVGGDVIKAYFAAKRTQNKKTEAVSTILIDRIIGLLALLLLTAIIMAIFLPFFLAHKETQLALIFNIGLLFMAVIGLIVVFRKNLFEQWSFFRRLEENTSLGKIISRVYAAFRVCVKHPGLLTKAIILSLANHLSLIICAYFLGRALEIPLTFLNYLTVFPVINAIAAIPVTPGGLGTREGATVFLLGVMQVSSANAITLSLLIYASILLWSLIGGIVYGTYVFGSDPGMREDLKTALEEGE